MDFTISGVKSKNIEEIHQNNKDFRANIANITNITNFANLEQI